MMQLWFKITLGILCLVVIFINIMMLKYKQKANPWSNIFMSLVCLILIIMN